MATGLEEFMKANRDKIDVHPINEKVWARVSDTMQKKEPAIIVWNTLFIKRIAAVFILAISVYFLLRQSQANNQLASNQAIAKEYPALGIKIHAFTQQIEYRKAVLSVIKERRPLIYTQFVADMSHLDRDYDVLIKEISLHANREILLTELAENLALQLRMLDQQLLLIRQPKESTKMQ